MNELILQSLRSIRAINGEVIDAYVLRTNAPLLDPRCCPSYMTSTQLAIATHLEPFVAPCLGYGTPTDKVGVCCYEGLENGWLVGYGGGP